MGLKGSVKCRVVALQQRRRVTDGRSFVYKAMPEGDLVGRKLGRAAEADASFLGGVASRAGSLMNERPLELGDAGEDRQDHPARRRGGGHRNHCSANNAKVERNGIKLLEKANARHLSTSGPSEFPRWGEADVSGLDCARYVVQPPLAFPSYWCHE